MGKVRRQQGSSTRNRPFFPKLFRPVRCLEISAPSTRKRLRLGGCGVLHAITSINPVPWESKVSFLYLPPSLTSESNIPEHPRRAPTPRSYETVAMFRDHSTSACIKTRVPLASPYQFSKSLSLSRLPSAWHERQPLLPLLCTGNGTAVVYG